MKITNRNASIILPDASWTALAERSGDSAFERTKPALNPKNFQPCESGVALRLPPQSKIAIGLRHSPNNTGLRI